MALRYLLDTDVIIWHLRGHEPTEALLRTIEDEQPLGCSALSAFEVWAGARLQEEEPTRRFLDTLNQIPADSRIALAAAGTGATSAAGGLPSAGPMPSSPPPRR